MKHWLMLLVLLVGHFIAQSQHVYKIKTDSLKITNDSCTAELILENSTKHVNGFLFNKGNGRTAFLNPAIRVGDSVYHWMGDTLNLGSGAGLKHVVNGLTLQDDSLRLGGSLDRETKINMNKKSFVFNITDGTTPFKGADVRIKGVRDTITYMNNLYVQHVQTGGHVASEPSGVGSIFAETWYNTTDSFNNGTFANYVSRHKSSFNTRMQNMRLYGYRSFFENYSNGNYGEFMHYHAQHVWGSSGHINKIYGLRLANMKGVNTNHAYAIATEGVADSVVFAGPVRISKYRNSATVDSVLSVDSIGRLVLKDPGSIGVNREIQTLNDADTIVWNLSSAVNGEIVLRGVDRSLSLLNPKEGFTYRLKIRQDSTGGRYIGDWPEGTLWSKGIKPTLTNQPNAVDMVNFFYDGSNFFGTFQPEFRASPTGVSIYSYDAKVGTNGNTHTFSNLPAGALIVLTTSFGTAGENASISSSPSLTWSKLADASDIESGDAEVFAAYFPEGGNLSVTSDWNFPYVQASTCYVILNAESVLGGAVAVQEDQSAPSVPITTTRGNSLLIAVTSDWNALDGSSRVLRAGATETNYSYTLGDVTSYHYYLQATTIDTYTLGLSAPTGQKGGTCIVEIRGN